MPIPFKYSDEQDTFPLTEYNTNLDLLDTSLAPWGAHLPHDDVELRSITSWAVNPANAGWSYDVDGTNKMLRRGIWCFIEFVIIRTGGTIANGSTGDISNHILFNIKEPWRPAEETSLAVMNQGRQCAVYVHTNGNVNLTSIGNTGDILNNHVINMGGWYILASANQ